MARKLDAGLDGRYLISRVLTTSTMKSEPGTPPTRGSSFGVAVSATATCMVGGSADGRRGGALAGVLAVVAALAAGGVTALAAPATATPARNLRRLTSGRGCFRAMGVPPSIVAQPACGPRRLTRTFAPILSSRRPAANPFGAFACVVRSLKRRCRLEAVPSCG